MIQAIEKAIEGGWKAFGIITNASEMNEESFKNFWGYLDRERRWQEIALDPTFWQALGKSCGWGKCAQGYHIHICEALNRWQREAHRFYDLILTGGDTEKFWEEILK